MSRSSGDFAVIFRADLVCLCAHDSPLFSVQHSPPRIYLDRVVFVQTAVIALGECFEQCHLLWFQRNYPGGHV